MFAHLGVYALLGRGEWVMYREGIPCSEYERLAERFNPHRSSADAWVDLARAAGRPPARALGRRAEARADHRVVRARALGVLDLPAGDTGIVLSPVKLHCGYLFPGVVRLALAPD